MDVVEEKDEMEAGMTTDMVVIIAASSLTHSHTMRTTII